MNKQELAQLSDLELYRKIEQQKCYNQSVELGICVVDSLYKIVPERWKNKLRTLEQERDRRLREAQRTVLLLSKFTNL